MAQTRCSPPPSARSPAIAAQWKWWADSVAASWTSEAAGGSVDDARVHHVAGARVGEGVVAVARAGRAAAGASRARRTLAPAQDGGDVEAGEDAGAPRRRA